MNTDNTCNQEIVSRSMEQLILQYDVHYQTLTNTLTQSQIRYL